MEELKNNSLAISLMIILTIIKFIVVPVMDWQNIKISEINLQARKLEKAENLLVHGEELLKTRQNLKLRVLTLKENFYEKQNQNVLQRKIQQTVEQELKALDLKVNTIGWQSKSIVDNTDLTQLRLEYRVEGKTVNVLKYLLNVNMKKNAPDVSILNLLFKTRAKGELGSVSAHIGLSFYMLNTTLPSETTHEGVNVES